MSGPGATSPRWMRNIPIVGAVDATGTSICVDDEVRHRPAAPPVVGQPRRRPSPPPTRQTLVGAPNESTTAKARPVSRSAVDAGDGDDVAEAVDDAERRAVGAEALARCRPRALVATTSTSSPHTVGWASTASRSATSVSQAAGSGGVERHRDQPPATAHRAW